MCHSGKYVIRGFFSLVGDAALIDCSYQRLLDATAGALSLVKECCLRLYDYICMPDRVSKRAQASSRLYVSVNSSFLEARDTRGFQAFVCWLTVLQGHLSLKTDILLERPV